jgi:hypothetical protein
MLRILSVQVTSMVGCLIEPQDCQELLLTIFNVLVSTMSLLPQFAHSFCPLRKYLLVGFQLCNDLLLFFSNGFTCTVLALLATTISFRSAAL